MTLAYGPSGSRRQRRAPIRYGQCRPSQFGRRVPLGQTVIPALVNDFGGIEHLDIHLDSIAIVREYTGLLCRVAAQVPVAQDAMRPSRRPVGRRAESARSFGGEQSYNDNGQRLPLAEDMERDMFKAVLLKLVVGLEDPPDR